MAIVKTDDKYYKEIADVLRLRGNTDNTYKPSEMTTGIVTVLNNSVNTAYSVGREAGFNDGYSKGFTEGLQASESVPSNYGFVPTEWDEWGYITNGIWFGNQVTSYYFYNQDDLRTSWDLHSITLPNTLYEIEWNAFQNNPNLNLSALPNSVNYIGGNAFNGCKSLSLTSLPSSLTFLGAGAFMGCENLRLNSLPDKLEGKLDSHAFNGCTNITISSLPKGITSLGGWAFANCTGIEEFTIHSGVTYLHDYYVFDNCTNLKKVTFLGDSNSRPYIGTKAFRGCTALTDIYVPWAEGAVANAPWGATNATIHYNTPNTPMPH